MWDLAQSAFSEVIMAESPTEAELLTLHKGLLVCKDQGLTDILTEGGLLDYCLGYSSVLRLSLLGFNVDLV